MGNRKKIKMRIYKNRFYVMMTIPGISGFQQWNEREFHIVTGYKAANNKHLIVAEWTPTEDESFRIEDGHLPECQPVGSRVDVANFLRNNPFQLCLAIGKAADRLRGRYYAQKAVMGLDY